MLAAFLVFLLFFSSVFTIAYGESRSEFIFTDKELYHLDDVIIVTGFTNSFSNIPVSIFLIDIEGNVIQKFKVNTDEYGRFVKEIASTGLSDGIYAIYGTYGESRTSVSPIQITSTPSYLLINTDDNLYSSHSDVTVTVSSKIEFDSEIVVRLYDSSDDVLFSKRISQFGDVYHFTIPSESFLHNGNYSLILYSDGLIQDKTSFTYFISDIDKLEKIFTGMYNTTPFRFEYALDGIITNVTINESSKSLLISLTDVTSGNVQLTLPDTLISADNDTFTILVDDTLVDYSVLSVDSFKNFKFALPDDSHYITIIGTDVIPEFGTITMMILLVSVVSIVIITAKSRLVSRI